ncbi:type III secretion system export apparatus subunit SctU [Paraburkholderia rhizosphaerae]|uniref:Type III secretion protein U n=1 Tax=Paraburkholderia rhizosphaerae TaxID=480658 RepID=A0A4R8LKW0_9BURK|nr:type III secretion system export apparatus subunit SctU [Paraburkholderia rhizosphaerae]TDY45164.1 type III secretion protein U [Paraburkholderia rhizosphaerae]
MSEKTEKPTAKKLKDARKKGSVSKSTDLISSATLLAMVLAFHAGSSWLLDSMREMITIALDFTVSDRTTQALTSSLFHLLGMGVLVCVPLAALGMLAAVLASAAQVGFKVSLEPVMPKLSSINPATGIKRVFSKRSLVDLVKMTIKAIVLIVVLWKTIMGLFPLVTQALYEPLPRLSAVLWSGLLRVLSVGFVLYLVIGALDWKLQHMMFIISQRMSKDEIKRERKNQDGDPKMKHERKQRAKELLRGDPRPAAVARANVMVVNPTHYAVALRYAPNEHPLPVVVASGVDADAATLRRLANEFDVPIVANPPVARALYRVDVSSAIPEDLFEVVAAILRWVESVGAGRKTGDAALPASPPLHNPL